MYPSLHPSFIYRWKQARLAGSCRSRLGCGPGAGEESADPSGFAAFGGATDFGGGLGGGTFGVRRPLRLLAYKLGLNESQVSEIAKVLNDLKTERAQAAVDDRRTLSALADALSKESFDEGLANQGAELRRKGAERLSEAVVKALGRIHALLDAAQRERLATLIRTGALVV